MCYPRSARDSGEAVSRSKIDGRRCAEGRGEEQLQLRQRMDHWFRGGDEAESGTLCIEIEERERERGASRDRSGIFVSQDLGDSIHIDLQL